METLKTKTDTELKALAYENIVQIEVLKKGLDAINFELNSRKKLPENKPTE